MKTNENIQLIRLIAVALVLACSVARAEQTTAGNKGEGGIRRNRLVEREIELHAPNSSTPTVTVWVLETDPLARSIETAPTKTQAKELSLPASNGSATSVMVWGGRK